MPKCVLNSRLSGCALLLALWIAPPAFAGDCGQQVRALLREAAPAAEVLSAAAEDCTAAYAGGDVQAGYRLALLYLGPLAWEPEKATPLIREAAVAGVPEAQYWVGWQLETGPLLPNDPEAALFWYQAAAAREHQLALLRLADAYDKGDLGLPREPRRAIEYRALAASCSTKGD